MVDNYAKQGLKRKKRKFLDLFFNIETHVFLMNRNISFKT